jgi:hypothetical protein
VDFILDRRIGVGRRGCDSLDRAARLAGTWKVISAQKVIGI